eukprot:SAG11_NODE_1541_length_4721_cov_6.831458_10_plen_40_part_00
MLLGRPRGHFGYLELQIVFSIERPSQEGSECGQSVHQKT